MKRSFVFTFEFAYNLPETKSLLIGKIYPLLLFLSLNRTNLDIVFSNIFNHDC